MTRSDRNNEPDAAPSPWVMRFAGLIQPRGQILDLACGRGRHSRYLLNLDYHVVAVDQDISGLDDLKENNQLEILASDLEKSPWPFTGRWFDGIVITNYLHRPHFPLLIDALAPGGVLIIETFAQGNERFGKPHNRNFLLKPGELLDAFARSLQVVAYEHGEENQPRPAVRQRLCAVRTEQPVLLNPDPR
jgi:SAM-dependent methyltransferase